MDAPTGPDPGDRLVIFGITVEATALLTKPFTVTTTFPLTAVLGTGTTICVFVQLLGVAVTPLARPFENVTVLLPCVLPKLLPVIVTEVPTMAEVGDRLLMAGVGVSASV
jgi:hypothetical protein